MGPVRHNQVRPDDGRSLFAFGRNLRWRHGRAGAAEEQSCGEQATGGQEETGDEFFEEYGAVMDYSIGEILLCMYVIISRVHMRCINIDSVCHSTLTLTSYQQPLFEVAKSS